MKFRSAATFKIHNTIALNGTVPPTAFLSQEPSTWMNQEHLMLSPGHRETPKTHTLSRAGPCMLSSFPQTTIQILHATPSGRRKLEGRREARSVSPVEFSSQKHETRGAKFPL